jgi:hypothetical protein
MSAAPELEPVHLKDIGIYQRKMIDAISRRSPALSVKA